MVPKLLVSNDTKNIAPFIDGTGSHAGALLGDVRHDPFQSGGLETPSHDRVEVGAIHRAHGGVLFIDEINTLTPHSQQNLLTALQEGEFPDHRAERAVEWCDGQDRTGTLQVCDGCRRKP